MKPTGVKGQMSEDLAFAIRDTLTVGEMSDISERLGRGTHYAYKLVRGLYPDNEVSQPVILELCKAAKKKSDKKIIHIEKRLNDR